MIFYILTAAGGFIVGATFGVVIMALVCAGKMNESSRIIGEWREEVSKKMNRRHYRSSSNTDMMGCSRNGCRI